MRSVTTTKALRSRTYVALLASSAALLAAGCGNHRPSQKAAPIKCINSCQPDLGPRAMTQRDCDDAESGIEFLPLPIWDFGPYKDSSGNWNRPIAAAAYFYDDKTSVVRVPGKLWEPFAEVAYSGVPPRPIDGAVTAGWLTSADYDDATKTWAVKPPLGNAVGRCGEPLPYPDSPEQTNASLLNDSSVAKGLHYALHIAGGPFMEWGGGMGRMLKCMNTDNSDTPWHNKSGLNKYLCANRKSLTYKYPNSTLAACTTTDKTPLEDGSGRTLGGLMNEVCPARDKYHKEKGVNVYDENDEPQMIGMSLDMTQWEGVSFWARRSPNSQEGIRVAMADKYTDDDMSFLSMKVDPTKPRYCERKIVCGCQNNKPCSPLVVTDNIFDMDGLRVRWNGNKGDQNTRGRVAVDGPRMDTITGEADILEIRTHRHSLIDLSGTKLANTFDDGEQVGVYNGPTGAGQPYDSDVLVPHIETFCFDPAVDPVPPDGLPLSQVMNRAYQNNRVYSDNLSRAVPNENGFFFNASAFNPDPTKTIFGDSQAQLAITDMTHTEQPGYNYTPCGDSFCRFEYTSMQASDPQSWNRACTPFAFKGGIDYSYCYNPGADPNPPEGTAQCGDFWLKPVALTPDWQFFKIPFSELLQQGWAKRFYQFDVSSLTDFRIQWDRGWADFWISDVRFYRTKKQ